MLVAIARFAASGVLPAIVVMTAATVAGLYVFWPFAWLSGAVLFMIAYTQQPADVVKMLLGAVTLTAVIILALSGQAPMNAVVLRIGVLLSQIIVPMVVAAWCLRRNMPISSIIWGAGAYVLLQFAAMMMLTTDSVYLALSTMLAPPLTAALQTTDMVTDGEVAEVVAMMVRAILHSLMMVMVVQTVLMVALGWSWACRLYEQYQRRARVALLTMTPGRIMVYSIAAIITVTMITVSDQTADSWLAALILVTTLGLFGFFAALRMVKVYLRGGRFTYGIISVISVLTAPLSVAVLAVIACIDTLRSFGRESIHE